MIPAAGTRPSLSELAKRNLSSQYGTIFCKPRKRDRKALRPE
jgi:hypothetical protein